MMWPGDWKNGSAAEVAFCKCVLDVEVRESGSLRDRDARISQRIDNATVIGTGVYDMTPEQIVKQADDWEQELTDVINANPNLWKSKKAYAHYARHVESKATKAPITIEDFTKIEGKELQIAQWFSDMGVEVRFRNHNKHPNKSDVSMLGMFFDFKRLESRNPKQVGSKVRQKLDTQGPGFVIDLSVSPISLEDGIKQGAGLLENEKVERIIVIKDARIIELRK